MAHPQPLEVTAIRETLEDGFSLKHVSSTEDELVLRFHDETVERTFSLSRQAVRALVSAGLLDAIAASAELRARGPEQEPTVVA